jgi:TorA maturation chaperone TorD
MADVAGFYRAHGLQVGGTERERPDHVVTELEFVSFLARKEAYALLHLGDDEVLECRRTSARFLREHLGRWGPDFGRRVALVAEHEALRTAGGLLAAWLDQDMAALAVVPPVRLCEPAPRPEPDDDTCAAAGCGADCGPGTPVELRSPNQ